MLEVFKQAARPFSIYAVAVCVCVAVFCPWVTPEKIIIAASLGGSLAGMRSLDKRAARPA